MKYGRQLAPDGEVWDNHIVELAAPFESFGDQSQVSRRAVETWRWKQFDHLVQDIDPALPQYAEDVEAEWRRYDINYCPLGGKARLRNSLPPNTESPSGMATFDPGHSMGKTGERDWLHANAISYDEARSLVMVSYNTTSGIIIVSRRTDTIVFRFGNPAVYRAGDPHADRILFCQHGAQFVDAPSRLRFLCFNNGCAPQRQWSTVDEYEIIDLPDTHIEETSPETETEEKKVSKVLGLYSSDETPREKDAPPACRLVWRHGPPVNHFGSFYAHHSSGVSRCANGNTLVTLGPQGIIFEVTPENDEVWRYVNPVEVRSDDAPPAFTPQGEHRIGKFGVFTSRRYVYDYPAFRDKILLPGRRLEDRGVFFNGVVDDDHTPVTANPVTTVEGVADLSLE